MLDYAVDRRPSPTAAILRRERMVYPYCYRKVVEGPMTIRCKDEPMFDYSEAALQERYKDLGL